MKPKKRTSHKNIPCRLHFEQWWAHHAKSFHPKSSRKELARKAWMHAAVIYSDDSVDTINRLFSQFCDETRQRYQLL